ncbi:MAG: dTMP kinase [Pseudomonadota bacterium]
MSTRGYFITLEGGEGTGKSTLIAGLAEALQSRNIDVVQTREPGGTVLAERIRSLALNPPENQTWSPLAHALLMNTARDDHLQKLIRPALERGRWVLCDRFSDSTRAYQSVDGLRMENLIMLERMVLAQTSPDLTLVLDGDPARLINRRETRGTRDVFEDKDLDFHRHIRDTFLSIANGAPERCAIINAEQNPGQVLAQALNVIDERLSGA